MIDEEYKKSLGCWLEYNITNLMGIEECERGFKALLVSNTCGTKPKRHRLKVHLYGSEDAYVILYGKRLYFSDLICSYLTLSYLKKEIKQL